MKISIPSTPEVNAEDQNKLVIDIVGFDDEDADESKFNVEEPIESPTESTIVITDPTTTEIPINAAIEESTVEESIVKDAVVEAIDDVEDTVDDSLDKATSIDEDIHEEINTPVKAKPSKEKKKFAKSKVIKGKVKGNGKFIESNAAVTNEDYQRNYQIRLRNNAIKKATFNFAFYAFIVSILLANVYFAFIKQQTPISEIAREVKLQNNESAYPKEGVEGYIRTNLKELLSGSIAAASGSGAKDWDVVDVSIREIVTAGDANANVYFTAELSTNVGSSTHGYILPLGYDVEEDKYYPTGKLITRVENDEDATMIDEEHSRWSFGAATSKSTETLASASSFLDNFFTLLYNEHKDVSSIYVGKNKDIGDDNFTYIQINKLEWYEETNAMGANAYVEYAVKGVEGLRYNVKTYMILIEDGVGGFKIAKIY